MRRPVKKKTFVEPDVRYSNLLVAKFINYVMQDGKKSIASRVVYDALEKAGKQLKKEPLEVFEKAVENVSPQMELRSRRIGGANYQVPIEVRSDRKTALAFRWIIDAARSQKGKPMSDRLAEEFVNATNNTGNAIKKKLDTHRMAEANKAFAHFTW